MSDSNKEITWQAPEFQYRYKNIFWYGASVALAAILIVLALWQNNLLFAIFVIIAEVMILFWAKETPRLLNFRLDNKGITIDKIKFYPYEDLKGFHVAQREDQSGALVLKTKNRLQSYVKILANADDIPKIKEFLKNYLKEIEYEESLVSHISDLIGF